jgi:hypothetical protein
LGWCEIPQRSSLPEWAHDGKTAGKRELIRVNLSRNALTVILLGLYFSKNLLIFQAVWQAGYEQSAFPSPLLSLQPCRLRCHRAGVWFYQATLPEAFRLWLLSHDVELPRPWDWVVQSTRLGSRLDRTGLDVPPGPGPTVHDTFNRHAHQSSRRIDRSAGSTFAQHGPRRSDQTCSCRRLHCFLDASRQRRAFPRHRQPAPSGRGRQSQSRLRSDRWKGCRIDAPPSV